MCAVYIHPCGGEKLLFHRLAVFFLLARSFYIFSMKRSKLSTGKRLTKPILFGTLFVGLTTAFLNRHLFMEDLADLREQERSRSEAKRLEVLEMRRKQIEEVEEKKRAGGR